MGATRRTSWMLGSTSDPAGLNILANPRVQGSQPSQNVAIDWSNPLTKGLLGVFLPNTFANLVDMRRLYPLQGKAAIRGAGAAGIELRSGAMEMEPPDGPTDSEAKFDGTVGTALTLCRQGTPTIEGLTFARYNSFSGLPLWGVGLWGGSSNGPYAVWHSYSFTPSTTLFDPTDSHRCIAISGDGAVARVYSDGRLVSQGSYTAVAPAYYPYGLRYGPVGIAYEDTNTFNALSLYWNRALSASELADLAQNPWQIFVGGQPIPLLFRPTPKPPPVEPWFTKRVRTSQPQQAVGIDWGNPITRGMVAAVGPTTERNWSVVSGTPTVGTTRQGRAFVGSVRIAAGQASASSDFTALVMLIQPASVSGSPRVAFSVGTLWIGSASGLLAGAPAISNSSIDRGIGPFVPNTPTTIVARRSGTSFSGWREGVFVGDWPSDSGNLFGTTPVTLCDYSSGGYSYTAGVILGVFWNRALSDAEIQSVSQNPWQIFAPTNATAWVPV